MKPKSTAQRTRSVRVDYESDRFSSECLASAYERLHPVDFRAARSGRDRKAKPSDREISRKTLGARR